MENTIDRIINLVYSKDYFIIKHEGKEFIFDNENDAHQCVFLLDFIDDCEGKERSSEVVIRTVSSVDGSVVGDDELIDLKDYITE